MRQPKQNRQTRNAHGVYVRHLPTSTGRPRGDLDHREERSHGLGAILIIVLAVALLGLLALNAQVMLLMTMM